MNRIIVLMGKSASGKDSVFGKILEKYGDNLKTIIPYTTRPMREGEEDGREYHFVGEEDYEKNKKAGRIIEDRGYNTVHGLWRYFTVSDGAFDGESDVFLIGTLDTFLSLKKYFKEKKEILPIYIECDDGDRLIRAVNREKIRENPDYRELCRRFLSDDEDFSEEKLKSAGVEIRIYNKDLSECADKVALAIYGH